MERETIAAIAQGDSEDSCEHCCVVSRSLSLFLLLRESPFSVEEQRDPVSTTPLLGKSYLETEREIDSATSAARESKSQWSEGRGNFWGERETERERDKVPREFDFE